MADPDTSSETTVLPGLGTGLMQGQTFAGSGLLRGMLNVISPDKVVSKKGMVAKTADDEDASKKAVPPKAMPPVTPAPAPITPPLDTNSPQNINTYVDKL